MRFLPIALAALTLFCGLASGQTEPKNLSNPEIFQILTSSYEALPYRFIRQPGRPLALEWKDGSKIAELELTLAPMTKTVPVDILASTCGQKVTGPLCRLTLKAQFVGSRLVWRKHPDATRIGKVVKTETGTFDSDSESGTVGQPISFNSRSNMSLTEPIGTRAMEMNCQNFGFLPTPRQGQVNIESMSVDENSEDTNILSPQNQTQTTSELYDLRFQIGDKGNMWIPMPKNPFDHIGYSNSPITSDNFAQASLFDLDRNTVLYLRERENLCRVRMKVRTTMEDLLAYFRKSKRTYIPGTPENITLYSQHRLPYIGSIQPVYRSFFDTLSFQPPVFTGLFPAQDPRIEEIQLLSRFGWIKNQQQYSTAENCGSTGIEADVEKYCRIQPEDFQ